ncbi:caspase family protein [Amycolatopsis sp. MJM2582]|uniref:wHTH domain-containing protein n=1 Tax=Amycolatopsis sp. MJM2582 TaxID=1427749 RepID=UPI0009DE4FFB|nr:caspase family protein [Amycolatopsis sp. MJM2582]
MADRLALLIGVPSCDHDLFEALHEVVAADIGRMAGVLAQSNYEVQHCGVGDKLGREPTGNRIRSATMRAFRDISPGGTLLLYFSGHGVTIDGKGYLVPQDAYAGSEGPDPESLVSLIPSRLGECRAGLIIFAVDACRDDRAGSLDRLPGGGELPYPSDGAFVLFNSCRPGERSQHGDDGSYFTQALAEVLDRRNSARTVNEVYAEVTRRMTRKAARIEGLEQTPELVVAHRSDGVTKPGDSVICAGDQVGEAWRRVIENTPLWNRCVQDATSGQAREAVLRVVDQCAKQWLEAQEFLTARAQIVDPWTAQDYPVRVLAAVDQCLPCEAQMTAVELAALISAPFLREAALSAGIRLAATIAPTDFTRTFHDGARSDLETTHAIYEHVCRRAEGLARRKRTEPRDALGMWLVHQWLAVRPSLSAEPSVDQLCGQLARAATGWGTVSLTENELCSTIHTLIECVDASADDQRLVELVRQRLFDHRMRALAAALWLGGVMAADPRRVSTVVVDHLGIGAEVQLSALHAATVNAHWEHNGADLELHAVCEHPALHAAFTDLAHRADVVLKTISAFDPAEELIGQLPSRANCAGLRPENQDGLPVFDTPLLRFRLSDDKVRELLMGRQLYGEPDLAIRELYQNALDACRYRDVRRRYLTRRDRSIVEWSGRISFRQGTDAEGREFIECTDNGVGMSKDTMMSTFANAGERFVYRSGFRSEQMRWQELDPPLRLIPNSQFGVGVFSYFMIAEEIHITTRPVGEDDVVGSQAFSVRIASSGSLFQITQSNEMPAGGTRIRLYLTGEDSLSVLRTLRRLLWIAEYTVDVAEANGPRETWQPELLRFPDAIVEPLKHGDDLWWVPGEGGFAADGVRTNEESHGLIVNLRGPHRPQFTVDRNRLRKWDKKWIRQQILESLPSLQEWAGLTLPWLWDVSDKTPAIAEDIFTYLLAQGHDVSVQGAWGRTSAPLSQVGCLPIDRELFTGEMIPWSGTARNRWISAWRVGAWKGGPAFAGSEHVAEPATTAGFPVVSPMDANVLGTIYSSGRLYRTTGQFGRPSLAEILEAAADRDESPAERIKRLRRYAITGIDLSAARGIPSIDYRFIDKDEVLPESTEEKALLDAVAALVPADEGGPAVCCSLAKASADLRVPLGEVIRRIAAFIPSDRTSILADRLGELGDHVFTRGEVELFTEDLFVWSPWVSSTISPAHVLRASSKLGQPVDYVLNLLDRFVALGYQIAGRQSYPQDLTLIEQEALRCAETLGFELSWLHLLQIASKTGETVENVLICLERLAGIGMIKLPAISSVPESLTEDELTIINDELYEFDWYAHRRVLCPGWLAVLELLRGVGAREFHDYEGRLRRRRRLLDIVDLRRPVSMPEIIQLAWFLDYDIARSVEYFRSIYFDTADLAALPSTAFEAKGLAPRREECIALLGSNYWRLDREGKFEVDWSLHPGDIVHAAASGRQPVEALLERLEPYRALGAPLPKVDSAARKSLPGRPADRYDLAMLTSVDDVGRTSYVAAVTPLWLVQTAGRLGWTLAEAHKRFAAFESIGVSWTYDPAACFAEIVSWQDLLILTEHLDGQEPGISGVVTDEHVTASAREIDETEEMVRDRLHRYAPLFGYEL